MLDITNIKHPQGFIIVTYALILLVPVPAYLLFFDLELLNKIDVIKLMLISVSVSGLNTFAMMPIGIIHVPKDSDDMDGLILTIAFVTVISQFLFFTISGLIYMLNYINLLQWKMPVANIMSYVMIYFYYFINLVAKKFPKKA